MHPLLAYALGLVTLPIGAAVYAFVRWSTGRDWGGGGCYVCDRPREWKLGEVTNLRFWTQAKLHAWLWARLPAHRKAAGDRWRDLTARGRQAPDWNPRYMR